jgi:hypothetical protein
VQNGGRIGHPEYLIRSLQEFKRIAAPIREWPEMLDILKAEQHGVPLALGGFSSRAEPMKPGLYVVIRWSPIPPRRVMVFKPSATLKLRINYR